MTAVPIVINAVKFYTVPEVAERVGVSRVAVLMAVHGGRIPATRVGRMWLISEVDADNYHPRAYVRRAPAPGSRKKRPPAPPLRRKVKVKRIK